MRNKRTQDEKVKTLISIKIRLTRELVNTPIIDPIKVEKKR